MSNANNVNITELLTSCNFVIKDLPDNLKCVKCKLLLKDACQVPCGCRFCRVCIDDVMASGGQLCPGVSEQCGTSKLFLFSLDYIARNSISRLTVKCANNGCVVECQLANFEKHLRECQRRIVECPFRELGCKQDKLCAIEIDGHLQHENRSHSEILIGIFVNINKDMETMKQRDEESRREIKIMKRELALKDEQIKIIIDRINHVENENKSIMREKEDLGKRVRLLTEKIEREIDERRENDELDMARVIEHVDSEIAAVTAVIGSNKDDLVKQIRSVRNDNQKINHGAKSTKDDICPKKSQLQSKQVISKMTDTKYDWLISKDIKHKLLGLMSDFFTGAVHPYTFRLTALDYTERSTLQTVNLMMNVPSIPDSFRIRLLIYETHTDSGQLAWPFEGRVVITVADRNRRETCTSISEQCRIERPSTNNEYGESNEFVFLHSELRKAGLKLDRGLRVSCEIFPSTG